MMLSAFGDEISQDLAEQLALLRDLNISGLELRRAWNVNVLHMTETQIAEVRRLCEEYGIIVSCIGSPIGKSPLAAPIETELHNLRRILEIAGQLGTRRVRIFSFYPPDTSSNAQVDQHVPEVVDRLRALCALAAEFDALLLLENEREVVGDTPERCLRLMQEIDHPALGFIWDPANFVQVGVAGQVDRWWDALGPHTAYVHVKDARLDTGQVKAAGEGDGQMLELIRRLKDRGYDGVFALEPHLAEAAHSHGFTGPDGMRYATARLRALLAEAGMTEA
jgi:sugar phosphate isomerase/epimerase